MPVVINEFELAPAGGQEAGGDQAAEAAGEAGQGAVPKPPTAPVQDAERIIRRMEQRMLRVRAY